MIGTMAQGVHRRARLQDDLRVLDGLDVGMQVARSRTRILLVQVCREILGQVSAVVGARSPAATQVRISESSSSHPRPDVDPRVLGHPQQADLDGYAGQRECAGCAAAGRSVVIIIVLVGPMLHARAHRGGDRSRIGACQRVGS